MSRKTKGLVALLAAALAGALLFTTTTTTTTTTTAQGDPNGPKGSALTGTKRILPSDPEDRIIMGIFRNCKFHIVKLRVQISEVETEDGTKGEEHAAVSSKEEVAAQLPPQDPKCDGVGPTEAEINKMKQDVGAEQAAIEKKIKAKKGGAQTVQTVPEPVG